MTHYCCALSPVSHDIGIHFDAFDVPYVYMYLPFGKRSLPDVIRVLHPTVATVDTTSDNVHHTGVYEDTVIPAPCPASVQCRCFPPCPIRTVPDVRLETPVRPGVDVPACIIAAFGLSDTNEAPDDVDYPVVNSRSVQLSWGPHGTHTGWTARPPDVDALAGAVAVRVLRAGVLRTTIPLSNCVPGQDVLCLRRVAPGTHHEPRVSLIVRGPDVVLEYRGLVPGAVERVILQAGREQAPYRAFLVHVGDLPCPAAQDEDTIVDTNGPMVASGRPHVFGFVNAGSRRVFVAHRFIIETVLEAFLESTTMCIEVAKTKS